MSFLARALKATIGVVAGFFLGGICGAFIGIAAFYLAALLELDFAAPAALASSTLVGALVGSVELRIAWAFEPLFIDKCSKAVTIAIGALTGAVTGFLAGYFMVSTPPAPVGTMTLGATGATALLVGMFVGPLVGVLLALKGINSEDPDPDRTEKWNEFVKQKLEHERQRERMIHCDTTTGEDEGVPPNTA